MDAKVASTLRLLSAIATVTPIATPPIATLTAPLPAGTELQYTGTISQIVRDQPAVEKNFTVHAVLDDTNGLRYLIEERGAGGWAWPERFGRFDLPARGEAGLKVLHTFDGNPYPLPVRSPVFEFPDELKAAAEWTDNNRSQYEVVRTRGVEGRQCWVVEVSLDRGRRHVRGRSERDRLLVERSGVRRERRPVRRFRYWARTGIGLRKDCERVLH